MSTGLYNEDLSHYRKLLNKKMELAIWQQSIWSKFMGFINDGRYEKSAKYGSATLRPTGKPIEVLKDFTHGGISMDIPIRYPLTDSGIAGKLQLLGNEEQIKTANKTISVNQIRHGVLIQDNKMSKQALSDPFLVKELMGNASAELQDWFNRWLATQPYFAFLQGYSEHLTRSTTLGGLGKTKKSHMNTYVAGAGRVSFSNTAATYEASVASAIGGLTSADVMSTEVIENMVYAASHNHRIQPITVGQSKLYPIVISDAAARQLRDDTKWKDRNLYAGGEKESNALFNGQVEGVYGGALILVDNTIPSAYVTGDGDFSNADSTTGDANGVQYGKYSNNIVSFMSSPVDTGARKPAVLFGASAIACGVASDISFENETVDYKQKKTEGADMIIGFEVSDIVDSDGYFGLSGDKRYENYSSLVAWTYSPSDGTW